MRCIGVDIGARLLRAVDLNGLSHEQLAAWRPGDSVMLADASAGAYRVGGREIVVDPVSGTGAALGAAPVVLQEAGAALVQHGLQAVAQPGEALAVGVVVPWSLYYRQDGRPSEAVLNAVRQRVTQRVQPLTGGRAPLAVEVVVPVPSTVAAWVGASVAPDGEALADLAAPVVIIDVGWDSISVLRFGPEGRLAVSASAQMSGGCRAVAARIEERLAQEWGLGALRPARLEDVLRQGQVVVRGEARPIGPWVAEVLAPMADAVWRAAEAAGGPAVPAVLTGGGAAWMQAALAGRGAATVLPQGVLGNARGAAQFARAALQQAGVAHVAG